MTAREDTIERIERVLSLTHKDSITVTIPRLAAERAVSMLKEQEAVVRCKDCTNCVKEPNGELYCDILAVGYEPLGSKKVTDDWFCADGRKRDD